MKQIPQSIRLSKSSQSLQLGNWRKRKARRERASAELFSNYQVLALSRSRNLIQAAYFADDRHLN
jgi:hypothetical protein